MKQYGFYFDSDRCTGCKTCELACKDYKDLGTDVNFRRIYEYTGGTWNQQSDGCWHQDVFAYYSLSLVTIVQILLVQQFVQLARCTKMKMVL